MQLVQESPYRFRIDRYGEMRVPGVVFASRRLIPDIREDRSLEQVANVATLPGIVAASYAMPDIHWGYGFPIGGVAATDVAAGGVVSPGGVGFDISCGVRLLAADLDRAELAPSLAALMDRLDAAVPRGMGKGAVWKLAGRDRLDEVLAGGSRYAVGQGHGVQRDLDRCEDYGSVADADPAQVGPRAAERGLGQVGSLGSVREAGQPVIVPGSMGTASYVLVGVAGGPAFASTCHGAGRVRSRHEAAKAVRGEDLRRDLEAQGIAVRGASMRGLAEEAPDAYKDISEVVAAAEGGGLCRRVARLVPIGVVKG
jgi:tRNA-splicing ligase RtcB